NYASSKGGAENTVRDITKNGGKAIAVQGDMSRKGDIERLFAEAKEVFGTIDILVNNAGIYEFAPLESITEEQFHKQFNLNVLGPILATQAAVKLFGPAGGSIVNISSLVSTMGFPNAAVYSGTKGALDAITRSLAKELGPRKIRVNAINPGMVETEGVRAAGFDQGDLRKSIEAQTPLGRLGQPEDIAPVAVFLASSDSAWITGETLRAVAGLR